MLCTYSTIETLSRLKLALENDNFEMSAVWLLSGNSAKETRREIMQIITGEKLPISKCGYHKVCDATIEYLKNKYSIN